MEKVEENLMENDRIMEPGKAAATDAKKKQPKPPKEKKVKEPKAPKPPKVKKEKVPKPPKEKKVKEPKAPKPPKASGGKKEKAPKMPKEKKTDKTSGKSGAGFAAFWNKLPFIKKKQAPVPEGQTAQINTPAEAGAAEKGAAGKAKKGKFKFSFGLPIRVQLILGFVIPIVFIVAIGVISYQKASEGLADIYETSSYNALEMTMTSMDEGMNTIAATVLELSQDKTLMQYSLGGLASDTTKDAETKKALRDNLNVKQTASTMLEDLHVVTVDGQALLTTRTMSFTMEMDSYIEEMKNSEDSYILDGKMIRWGSKHPFIDSKMELDSYLMFCSRTFSSGSLKGVVIADVSQQAVLDLLTQLDFGEGSYIAFITAEGVEISPNEDFVAAEVEGVDWEKESDYLKYKGKTYFYMTVQSSVTGGRMLALVPKSYITASSDSIRSMTVVLVILACVIALLLSMVIITGISSNIKRSVVGLERVSKGDFTENKAKKEKTVHNEFGKLHRALRNTITTIRGLISTVSEMKDAVLVSGDTVMESSIQLSEMVENASAQVQEINSIIATQNEEITGCNNQMEQLSVQIKSVSESVFSTIDNASSSRKMIDEGMKTVEEMVHQSGQSADATKEVQEHVVKLANKLTQITDFVNDIEEIADQTNLLSLNASIEAARAGEQGRGFAVVAEEIRKLADNSGKTAKEIQGIIEEITVYSENAISKVSDAETISGDQMKSAKLTIDAFESMNNVMEGLIGNMQGISKEVEEMNAGRHETLKSIRRIGESSEHTVVAASEVNNYLEKQMQSAESLKSETVKLKENMEQLQQAIQTFKL